MPAWSIFVVVVLVLMAVVGVVAAFWDRRRARDISHDLGGQLDRRRTRRPGR